MADTSLIQHTCGMLHSFRRLAFFVGDPCLRKTKSVMLHHLTKRFQWNATRYIAHLDVPHYKQAPQREPIWLEVQCIFRILETSTFFVELATHLLCFKKHEMYVFLANPQIVSLVKDFWSRKQCALYCDQHCVQYSMYIGKCSLCGVQYLQVHAASLVRPSLYTWLTLSL